MIEAREATGRDLRPLAGTLARAFHDDPAMAWMFGDRPGPRLRRLRRFFRHEARRHRAQGRVLIADRHAGAAFWDPPEHWRTSWRDALRSAPAVVPALGPRLPRTLRGLEMLERAHPRQPHWYLAVVGTDPAHRGRGLGRALLDPVLAECDVHGLGAYLESSKERNIPWYERFGFAVTGRIELPDGPPVWPMWRDPR